MTILQQLARFNEMKAVAIASIGYPKPGLVLDKVQLGKTKGEKELLHTQAVEVYMKKLYAGEKVL